MTAFLSLWTRDKGHIVRNWQCFSYYNVYRLTLKFSCVNIFLIPTNYYIIKVWFVFVLVNSLRFWAIYRKHYLYMETIFWYAYRIPLATKSELMIVCQWNLIVVLFLNSIFLSSPLSLPLSRSQLLCLLSIAEFRILFSLCVFIMLCASWHENHVERFIFVYGTLE